MRITPFILAAMFASSICAGAALAQASKADQTSKA